MTALTCKPWKEPSERGLERIRERTHLLRPLRRDVSAAMRANKALAKVRERPVPYDGINRIQQLVRPFLRKSRG